MNRKENSQRDSQAKPNKKNGGTSPKSFKRERKHVFDWSLGVGIPLVLLGLSYFSGRPSILYAIPAGLGFCIWASLAYWTNMRRKGLSVVSGVLTILMFFACYRLLEFQAKHASGLYAVDVIGSIYSPQRSLSAFNLWYAHHTKYGDTLSPVQDLLYLRITNLRDFPVTVKNYELRIRTKGQALVPLLRMNLQYGQLFAGPSSHVGVGKIVFGPGVSNGTSSPAPGFLLDRVNVAGQALDLLLADRALQPHETIRGMALFEVPPEAMPDLPKAELLVTFTDTGGTEFSCSVPYQPPGGTYGDQAGLEQAELRLTGEGVDIRNFHLAFFSEFYK